VIQGIPMVLLGESNHDLCVVYNVRARADDTKWEAIIYEPYTDALMIVNSMDCTLSYLHGEKFDPKNVVDYIWQKMVPINMLINNEFSVTFADGPILNPTDASKVIKSAMEKYAKHLATWTFEMGGQQ